MCACSACYACSGAGSGHVGAGGRHDQRGHGAGLSPSYADALTKVMFVAGMGHAMVLAKELSVDVLVVDKAGQWRATPGFDA